MSWKEWLSDWASKKGGHGQVAVGDLGGEEQSVNRAKKGSVGGFMGNFHRRVSPPAWLRRLKEFGDVPRCLTPHSRHIITAQR